jgi:hypothetical protein
LESEDASQKRGGFILKDSPERGIVLKDLPEGKIKQKGGGEKYAEIQFP